MSAGVGYALLSLLCAGVLDVVFGRFSSARPVSRAYLVATGVFVMIGQCIAMVAAQVPFTWSMPASLWGVVAGAIALLANALLIESLARLQVSLGSTIYRLNTIAVVVLAVVFLGEALTWLKLSGIAFGVAGVALLYQRGGRGADGSVLLAALWMAITASLLRAAFGIVSKFGLAGGSEPLLFMLYIGAGWTLAAFVYGSVRRTRAATLRSVLPYAALSGMLICLVASFLMLGLRSGEASVVIPIANMSFVVALLVASALGMERITPRKLLAVGSAALAIALLTRA